MRRMRWRDGNTFLEEAKGTDDVGVSLANKDRVTYADIFWSFEGGRGASSEIILLRNKMQAPTRVELKPRRGVQWSVGGCARLICSCMCSCKSGQSDNS